MSVAAEIFLSPQMSKVTHCGAADIAADYPARASWIDMLVMRVTFHSTPPADRVPFALQLVRSVETAIDEYSAGREHLTHFVQRGRKASDYFRALNYFELAIAQICRPREHYSHHPGKFLMPPDDVMYRLQKLCDISKHQPALADQTLWITDQDLRSFKAIVKFDELEASLRALADVAVEIVTPTATPP